MKKTLKKLWKIVTKRLKRLWSKLLSLAGRVDNAIQAHLPLKRIILLESYPDFSDNTMAVFRYLRKQMDKHHFRMIWITEVDGTAPEGSRYVNWRAGWRRRRQWERLRRRAKVMVSCNRFFLTAMRKGQITVFLTHGSPLKTSPGYKYFDRFDYVLTQSEWLSPYMAEENQLDRTRLVNLGIPRNDDLYDPGNALFQMNFMGYQKVIVWLPTYRQHKKSMVHDMERSGLGMPLLQTRKDVGRLNDILVQENCLLVIKPHPSQDLRMMRLVEASHVAFIDDELLRKKGVSLYTLLGASDALLTDYSSVIYDYLLCDKPIGLTTDDFEQYCEKRGFVYEDPGIVLKGYHLKDFVDLTIFIQDICKGDFLCREELAEVRELANDFKDKCSSQRVGDFIISLLDSKNQNSCFPTGREVRETAQKAKILH